MAGALKTKRLLQADILWLRSLKLERDAGTPAGSIPSKPGKNSGSRNNSADRIKKSAATMKKAEPRRGAFIESDFYLEELIVKSVSGSVKGALLPLLTGPPTESAQAPCPEPPQK